MENKNEENEVNPLKKAHLQIITLILITLLITSTILKTLTTVASKEQMTGSAELWKSKDISAGGSNREVTLFFDDFEDDSVGSLPDGWVVHWGGEQYGVSTEHSYSGSKSLMVEGRYSWSCVLARPFESSARYIGFEARIFITEPDTLSCPLYGCPDLIVSFGCYECLGPWGDVWNHIVFNHSTKEIVVEDVRTNDGYRHFKTIGTFEYYKWIDIKVILDRDQAVYHVWINGNLLAENVPVVEFRGLNENTYLIDRLTVGSGWSGAKIYIDDVRVFELYPSTESTDLDEGLVAYYSFDDGTAKDLSGNHHDGIIHGDPKVIEGIVGKALYFDGEDDYIELNDFPEDFSKGITIAAWVRFDEPRWWSRIIDLGNGAAWDNILFAEARNTSNICFEVYNDYGALDDWALQKVMVKDVIKFGTWMHVVAVGQPEGNLFKVSIYINGEKKATVNWYGDSNDKTNIPRIVTRTRNYIAKSNWGHDELFKGALDEIRIYNRPLTEEEIIYLFQLNENTAIEYPNVVFTVNSPLITGVEVSFDASSSYDPDGYIVEYIWDFGDGRTLTTSKAVVTHVYEEPGEYTVTLTVVDNDGLKASVSKSIEVIDITTDVVELINDILGGLRSSVDADVRHYGEYWGIVYGTVVGDLLVNWYWDELKAYYGGGDSGDPLKHLDNVLKDVNFAERLEKYLSEAGVDAPKLSEVMENYRKALTCYGFVKDVHEVYKVLKEGDVATWLITQLGELVEQGAKDAVFYKIVQLSKEHVGSLAADTFIEQLRNEGYYDIFSQLTEDEIENLRNYLASLPEEDYYNLLDLLSYFKEQVESMDGTYLSYLPLYDGDEERWVGSIAWHVRYVGDAIDYWASGERSKLIAKFGNYISGALGYKALPPFLLASSVINLYIDKAFDIYGSFEFAALTNLGEATKDFSARLRIYQQLANFVRHIDRYGDEIGKIWDSMHESKDLPSEVTIPIGSTRYECVSGASQISGVIYYTENHMFPYAETTLDDVGIYITAPTEGSLQHQFYGSPTSCFSLKDTGSKAACSLLAQETVLVNAVKPNIEIKYTSSASLSTVNVNLINHGGSMIFVCAGIYTPLLSLEPDDFKCTVLTPNNEVPIFTNVNAGMALGITAGSGYIVYFTPSIALDIIGNWVGSVVTLTEDQHKLFAKVMDNEGRVVGVENGELRTEIPGAYYVDFMNGTIKIFLPPSLTEYNVIVDALNATDQLETYTLHIAKVDNGELISAITVNATIAQKEKQTGIVRIQENQLELAVVNMSITRSSAEGQASITSTTSTPSAITTSQATSGTSPSTKIPAETPSGQGTWLYLIVAVVLIAAVIAAIALKTRK